MREILFRGKRVDNGQWLESGSFCRCGDDGINWDYYLGTGKPAIHEIDPHGNIRASTTLDDCMFCMVDSNTIGQYTGLTDKNGKKIFEGDIVHVLGNQQVDDWKNVNYIGSVAFLDAGFCVIDGTIEDHAFRRYQLPRLDFDLEVIGNIHDNPELLEVE